MAASDRFSVGSLGSLISSSTEGTSVDSSFMSFASVSSSGSLGYEIESEVGREALKEICCSALSRTLDFPDCQLATLLGYEEENSNGDAGGGNVAKNITASLRSMRKGLSSLYHHHHHYHAQTYQVSTSPDSETNDTSSSLTFGSPLSESNQLTLLQLITHMLTFISKEGLFRKSGNKGRMDLLVKGLEGGQFGRVTANAAYNAHDFASVLKQYFSELPEPLLLKRHLNAYFQVADLSPTAASRAHCLQLLMLLLPPVHRVVLQHLLDLLFQVSRSPDNKMDSHNLSLIFAPTLFLASRSESLSQDDFAKLSQLLAYMIENYEDIFEVPPEVQVVAERYIRKRSWRKHHAKQSSEDKGGAEEEGEEEDVPIDLYTTSCKRACVETFHESGKERAMDEVAKLYELVMSMPDGPQKTHFMKRFDQANKSGCTPTSVSSKRKHLTPFGRLKRSLMRNKENATPKISTNEIQLVTPCFKKAPHTSEHVSKAPPTNPRCPDHTPCQSRENFMTPAESATPANCVTPCELFKTPGEFKTPSIPKYRGIPTNSTMVTDV